MKNYKKGISHKTHTILDEWIEAVYGKEYAEKSSHGRHKPMGKETAKQFRTRRAKEQEEFKRNMMFP